MERKELMKIVEDLKTEIINKKVTLNDAEAIGYMLNEEIRRTIENSEKKHKLEGLFK